MTALLYLSIRKTGSAEFFTPITFAFFAIPARSSHLRKMAIDGYIIYTDTADIKAFTKELSAIGRNINQIAKRINAGGPAYQADMDEIRERLDEIWQLQRHILSSQR